jgi:hypothetical protein
MQPPPRIYSATFNRNEPSSKEALPPAGADEEDARQDQHDCGTDLTAPDCDAIMAKVLERAGNAAHATNEQGHESQRPDN